MVSISPNDLPINIHNNEIQIIKMVKHPKLPQLYDVINLKTTIALVMEYLEGINLIQYVETHGPIPSDLAKEYIIQLCDTVHYLHTRKNAIIHCDIKPNNIMLSEDTKDIFLLDLGLARIVANNRHTEILGRTDGYSPPEFYTSSYFQELRKTFYFWQCTSIAYPPQEGHLLITDIDSSSDIYSIGATMFYMLTGHHPSYGSTNFDLITELYLKSIIQRAMNENRRMRYQSVYEFQKDVEKLKYKHDVALSFAGEDRKYVEQVAKTLEANNIRVFYDTNESVQLLGKDLTDELDKVFRYQSRYCVMFISQHYIDKSWPTIERTSALKRAKSERKEYIIPGRFDDTTIPELFHTDAHPNVFTDGYIDLQNTTPQEFAQIIIDKLRIDSFSTQHICIPPKTDNITIAI